MRTTIEERREKRRKQSTEASRRRRAREKADVSKENAIRSKSSCKRIKYSKCLDCGKPNNEDPLIAVCMPCLDAFSRESRKRKFDNLKRAGVKRSYYKNDVTGRFE